jgi:hypothetical protein
MALYSSFSPFRLNKTEGRKLNSHSPCRPNITGENFDIFRSDGTVNKKWLPEIDFDEAFRRAYNEIRTQWEKNREWFLTRQPLA